MVDHLEMTPPVATPSEHMSRRRFIIVALRSPGCVSSNAALPGESRSRQRHLPPPAQAPYVSPFFKKPPLFLVGIEVLGR
jgi:hypothetical protein